VFPFLVKMVGFGLFSLVGGSLRFPVCKRNQCKREHTFLFGGVVVAARARKGRGRQGRHRMMCIDGGELLRKRGERGSEGWGLIDESWSRRRNGFARRRDCIDSALGDVGVEMWRLVSDSVATDYELTSKLLIVRCESCVISNI